MFSGHGPLNSLLKLLVFGDVPVEDETLARVEEGRATGASPSSSPATPTPETTTVQYVGRLLLCIAGLQGAYLTWGVLQVRLMMLYSLFFAT